MKVTGSLQEKNGIFQMVVRVPDINGNQKQKSKSTKIKAKGKNQRETRSNKQKADRMLAEWLDTLSRAESYGADKDLIASIEDWLAMKKKQLRADSYEAYLCNYKGHIKPYFEPKHLTLGDVTPRVILQYVRSKEDRGQSRSSIRKHLVILNGVFKEAVAMGELTYNPCANITVKNNRDEHFEGTACDIATVKKLLEVVKGDPIEPAVYLGLFLGLRRSEAVGLRWKDVDMENGIVHIRNTVVRFSTISELEKTKSRASKRDLFMPKALKEYLQTVWDRQEEERKLTGRTFSDTEHICQWADGTVFQPDYVSQRFAKILKKNSLPHIRFHDLRHTAGSLLVNGGHTIKQVQEFLGHEKASTTLDIYTHVSMEGKKDTALAMDKLFA
jgi:integrase